MKHVFLSMLFLCLALQFLGAELNDSQRWVIALSGIMTEVNQDRHDTLEFEDMSEYNVNRELAMLKRDWGITNREQLLGTLVMMERTGHAAELAGLRKILAERTPDNIGIVDIYNDFQMSQTHYNRLMFTAANWASFADRSILVWDLGRNIALCRWGYACGFLTADESWKLMYRYARIIQPMYTSWEDYGYDYCLGRIFWASGFGSEMDYFLATESIYRRLTAPDGYWSSLKWDEDLSK